MRNNDTACPSPLPPRPGSRYGIRVCPRKNASPGDSLLPPPCCAELLFVARLVLSVSRKTGEGVVFNKGEGEVCRRQIYGNDIGAWREREGGGWWWILDRWNSLLSPSFSPVCALVENWILGCVVEFFSLFFFFFWRGELIVKFKGSFFLFFFIFFEVLIINTICGFNLNCVLNLIIGSRYLRKKRMFIKVVYYRSNFEELFWFVFILFFLILFICALVESNTRLHGGIFFFFLSSFFYNITFCSRFGRIE